MIPKIIHYCWFGNSPKNSTFLKCLESWKMYCPDFEFKEWNEYNTKEFQNKFYKDTYRKKQYAFVADCVRVQALEKYGGVYLDTDMLLLKPINELISLDFFIGLEVKGRPAYGIFGGIPNHRFFKSMKDFYTTNYFNPFSPPVITHTFKDLIRTSSILNTEEIFDPTIFYALSYQDKDKDFSNFITKDSYAVHLWDHSWHENKIETITSLITKLWIVFSDTFFYNYPIAYFKRYSKEFARKLYHKLVGKK